MRLCKLTWVAIILLYSSLSMAARPIPNLSGPVVDEAQLLSYDQRQKIAAVLSNYYLQTKNQLQVLIIDSLQGDSIEEYSMRVAENWKIGLKPGTGIILLIAVDDRQLRLEVGSALEGALTDAQAGRIINDIMTPHFRQQQFYEGIGRGLSAVADALGTPLSGLALPTPARHLPKGKVTSSAMFWVIVVLFILSSLLRPRRRGWMGGLASGGFSGGGFGRGGSGWSGGGGGFSGGGASGRW